MLYRKINKTLHDWKNKHSGKALCVLGARQIGKTTAIRQFGQQAYDVFAELNFIETPDARSLFDGALDADTLITNITAYTQKKLVPGKTLLFFDEIQACPNARTAIKFLVEDGRFDYIESGSLLGACYKHIPSYPVGFEEIVDMYPMDLEEFLLANDVQQETLDMLRDCFENGRQVPPPIHKLMLQLFYRYMVVGGMPDAVSAYVGTHDVAAVMERQNEILKLYRLDIAQYAEGADRIKIQNVFDSIPSQLDSKNRRFILAAVDTDARHRRYEDTFNWLADAGVALPCYNVTEPQPPLTLNEKRNVFKLFMGDTGLLCAACMNDIQFSLLNGEVEINLGSILENSMAQQLKSNGFRLHYYDSRKFGEIDFVVQNGMKADLIEIKSGNDYHAHAALNRMRRNSAWEFGRTVVFCKGNVEQTDGLLYLPWYMIQFLKPFRAPSTYIDTLDLSALRP